MLIDSMPDGASLVRPALVNRKIGHLTKARHALPSNVVGGLRRYDTPARLCNSLGSLVSLSGAYVATLVIQSMALISGHDQQAAAKGLTKVEGR